MILIAQHWTATWMGNGKAGWMKFSLPDAQPFPVTQEFWNDVANQLFHSPESEAGPGAILLSLTPMADAPPEMEH